MSWETGTWADEFTPIYLGLNARGIRQVDADAMDLTTVAAVLGVGANSVSSAVASNDPHAVAQALNRERMARAEAAQEAARLEGRVITLAEAETEAEAVSWEALQQGR